jgi:hypothetical protein
MSDMKSVLSERALNLLCALFSAYKAGDSANQSRRVRDALDELREELGTEEYACFERDLSNEMRRKNAWQAVAAIIGAALKRKKEAIVLRFLVMEREDRQRW